MTGLKFMLDHGVFILALVTDEEAREIVRNWMSGYYRLKDVRIIGHDAPKHPDGWLWAVEVDNVRAVHSFDPTEMLVQMRQAKRTAVAPSTLLPQGPFNTPVLSR